VSKKYKGGADLKKMHKENEEMYEYYLETMGDLTEIKNEYSKMDGQTADEISMFKMMDELEKIKPIMYSILETKIKINKKYQELNTISKLTNVNIDTTLQKVIEDVDTYVADFVLDINQIIVTDTMREKSTINSSNKLEERWNNLKNNILEEVSFLKTAIKEKEGSDKNMIYLVNYNINKKLFYLIKLLKIIIDNKLSNEIENVINYKIQNAINNKIQNEHPLFEKLIAITQKYINQVEIEFGYKKENDNFDNWINGRPEEKTELKKWVFQNNTNLKQFKKDTITDSKIINERATEIKKTEKEKAKNGDKDEDKNENEVNFQIETYPDALDFFKNPKPAVFTNYTTRVTKKQHKKIKRRIDEVNNRLATLTHYKKIKDWEPKQSKNIKATIDEKGEITVL
jgi:hypothetical protein